MSVETVFQEKRELHIKGLTIDWDKISESSYLRNIESVSKIQHMEFHKPITFFVGENGSGKSTLLEAIAVSYGFNPEGGTKNYSFSTYDSHSEMCDAIRLIRGFSKPGWGYFLRAESFYNVASAEEEYSKFGGIPQHYHEKSHGESFLAMAQSNFRSNGVYLLDEPEAALSPQRQLTLLMEIVRCAKEGSQFIIVTHSPILLGIPDAEIISFDDGEIHTCDYEDTDSYQITEMFINNRKQFLKRLLDE
ncbi:MAG: AAA family ATPase [Lachnospiraceae bacterium]|nr:AAA family ATPase [Lachnospiraceae bacterium]